MLAQLRRDVAHFANRLSGRRSVPVVKVRGHASAKTNAKTRELRIARVVRETHDVVTLVLRDESGARFDFLPGQFFTVTIDGVSRNYSASNVPGGSELHLTIKKKEGGLVSPLLASAITGTTLRVAGPYGSFTVDATSRRLVLVAGGVGITALVGIARTFLTSHADSEVALLYGNRSVADIAFEGDLEALVGACSGRFVLRHVLDSDGERLDRATTARILSELPRSFDDADVFVCGPDAMMSEVLAALPGRRVRTERFVVGPRAPTAPSEAGARTIAISVNGREHRAVALAGATLLDAGIAAGVPMPFSCSVGGCGACRVQVIEGSVTMEEPNCLTSAEREAGFVLACVGRPDAGGCKVRIEGEP